MRGTNKKYDSFHNKDKSGSGTSDDVIDQKKEAAYKEAYEEILKNMLDRKVDFDSTYCPPDQKTPSILYTAIKNGCSVDLINKLIAKDTTDIHQLIYNKYADLSYTIFEWAIREGHSALVTDFIARPGFDVNRKSPSATHALAEAFYHNGNTKIFEELLNHPDIDFNKKDGMGATPLFILVNHSNEVQTINFLKALLTRYEKIDFDLVYNCGPEGQNTALQWAEAMAKSNQHAKDYPRLIQEAIEKKAKTLAHQ